MTMRLAKMAVFGVWALFAQLAAKAQEGLPPPRSDGERKRFAYATRENRPVDNHATEEVNAYPIDLATAIQLANANSPLIRIAQARMGAAQARKDLAELLFVPTLKFGPGYFRHDGVDQNRRGDVLHFVERWFRSSIREKHAITTEISIMFYFAKITTVCRANPTIWKLLINSMIPKFPNEPTLQTFCRMNCFPIFGKRAIAISHCMRVLTHN